MLLATWFGVGFSPVAPGTCAALAVLPLAWVLRVIGGELGLAAAALLLLGGGCWAAGIVATARNSGDPAEIVIDEVAGQLLVLLMAPPNLVAWLLAFLVFRLFDIWKPWPVGWADRHIKGGFGIMLDDVLAAGYAVLALAVLLAIAGAIGVRL